MKFDPNEPAQPRAGHPADGFTKREALIKGAWEAILSNSSLVYNSIEYASIEYAQTAIKLADALILELSKKPAP